MQNPLRRAKGDPPLPRDRDVERNKNDDAGYLGKDVRAHLVAMSGEFVGTFMFLYFAFAATQIASTSNVEAPTSSFREILGPRDLSVDLQQRTTRTPMNRKTDSVLN